MTRTLIYYHLLKSGLLTPSALNDLQIEPLASGTNQVFLVASGNKQYVIKIPKAAAHSLIDRKNESQASQITAAAGISIPLSYFDLDSGINISVYQPHSQTLTTELLQQTLWRQAAANLLQQLHRLPQRFLSTINIFAVLDIYRQKVTDKLPADLTGLLDWSHALNAIREEFSAMAITTCPCHGDPILTNFLLTADQQIYLIDWEYAGNNDPCWDLASFAVEAEFNPAQEQQFLDDYFQRPIDHAELRRLQVYKVLANYLWALWCIVMTDLDNARRRAQRFNSEIHKIIPIQL